jgi:hypothetical protein
LAGTNSAGGLRDELEGPMYQAKAMANMPQAALVSQRCFDIMRRYPLQTSEVIASVIVIV